MAKKREIIKLSKDQFRELTYSEDLYLNDEDEPYLIFVEDDIVYHDSEKSYVDKVIIIRRNSDNKFFRGYYSRWGAGNIQIDNSSLEEVFPKRVTITKYE